MAVYGWSDLPADLLAAVYLRSASAFDRARFAAVCTSWRAVAAWYPRLPALPLLLPLTGDLQARAYSPEDGRALPLRVPLPGGNRFVGSYEGGWIATASDSNELLVVNLFSGDRLPLSAKQRFITCACPSSFWGTAAAVVRKIVFSADPSSGSCILAAITDQCDMALCRVGCPDAGWTTQRCGTSTYMQLVDVAFCNGELYGCAWTELFRFNIGVDRDGAPVANKIDCLDIEMSALSGLSTEARHIFELRGNLAIAIKVFSEGDNFYKVFELALRDTMWEEVSSLGDHALFLGRASSKAVHVSLMAGKRGEVKGNHIYDSYHNPNRPKDAMLEVGSCIVYYWESKGGTNHLEKILSRGYYSPKDENFNTGYKSCMWLWPPDF
jgi:hypothetical protein